jgi:cellobiose phosphorylase
MKKPMQYGHFDSLKREYVITNPATPEPWVNYLGSPEYGAIISGNAEGYSFVKSGANGRILRFRFNTKIALPGRFIYIKDTDDGDFWSNAWQPVAKDLKKYKTQTRHGLGYTIIESEYKKISSKTTYYVPLNKSYEVWCIEVTNNDKKQRNLELTGFCEFTNHPNYEKDSVDLQYSKFITKTEYKNNVLTQTLEHNADDEKVTRNFGVIGMDVQNAWGDLDKFIGGYRTYGNPVGIEEKSETEKNMAFCGNCCGALQGAVSLEPGETKTVIFILSQVEGKKNPETVLTQYNLEKVEKDSEELSNYWLSKLDNLKINTPSPEFNEMVNTWNAYQCFITFIWSRAASFVYCGLRNGYGYRDTVQDIQGIIHLDPKLAKDKIRFMLSAQVDNGAGLPLVKFNHNAGFEDTPDDDSYVRETGHPSYRADDALWLFPTVYKYISETGDVKFLDEVIVYANGGEDTVYNHLKLALKFTEEHLGDHNLPAGLHADWNDCLRLGEKGESTFVAFQLYYAFNIMTRFSKIQDDIGYLEKLAEDTIKLSQNLSNCWDEDRFIRGIRENGEKVGAKNDKEANMWLNPQSWSVISNFTHHNGINTSVSMDTVYKKLNTEFGAVLLSPYYHKHYFNGALMHIYNPGCKENGGIFSQSQGWLILAEALLGHGDRAFKYFTETSPAAFNDKAEIRGIEPYAHGQFTEGKFSPNEGRSHVHWLTGTASTVMVGCVEGILGLRPTPDGIVISPSIPKEWKEMTVSKVFRGKNLNITVKNPKSKQSGVKSLALNGKNLDGNFIKASLLKKDNEIEIILG